jgi:hypothetical protein
LSKTAYDEAIGCYEALRSDVCCQRIISVPGLVMFNRGGLAAWLSARPVSTPMPTRGPSSPTDAAAPPDNALRTEVTNLLTEMVLSHQRLEGEHGNRRAAEGLEGNGKPPQARRLSVHQAVYSAPGV